MNFPAFSLFLIEYLEIEFKGNRYLSYSNARTEALPRWNQLTKNARQAYKSKAEAKKSFIRKMISDIWDYDRIVVKQLNEKVARKEAQIKKFLLKVVENGKGM